jgi:hypothetical protein
MARSPELEALLQALYDLDHCAPSERDSVRQLLDKLVAAALEKSGVRSVSEKELLMALEGQYREFSRAKRLEERRRLSRLK